MAQSPSSLPPVEGQQLPPNEGKMRVRTRDAELYDYVYVSPVDTWQHRFRRVGCLIILALLLFVILLVAWRFLRDDTPHYADDMEHFKYGSIGAEPGGSLSNSMGGLLPPARIFAALPLMFPDRAPRGFRTFGLLYETGHEALPIGVTQRYRLGFEQVGLNCAVCHVGTYRLSATDFHHIVVGMPANRLRLQEFFEFVLNGVLDPRFTPDNVIGTLERTNMKLGPIDKFLYRYVLIPRTVAATLEMKGFMGPLMGDSRVTRWGAGRVDTFNPYKALQFHWNMNQLPLAELSAASDYPSLWNQKPRGDAHMELHWDGNNDSLDERNRSASLGAGVTPMTIDYDALGRVAKWVQTLPPPQYPLPINQALAQRGAAVYAQYCTACHADARFKNGVIDPKTMPYLGHVEPWDRVGTDVQRLNAYTPIFAQNQYTLYPDSKYRFTHFKKTYGYSNQPLDGIWIKAPYLHNGSVPTLRDLLEPPANRPKVFYRGYDVFDQVKVGFVSNVAREGDEEFTPYDTNVLANSNAGHLWGTQLPPADKDAIVEYMKTF